MGGFPICGGRGEGRGHLWILPCFHERLVLRLFYDEADHAKGVRGRGELSVRQAPARPFLRDAFDECHMVLRVGCARERFSCTRPRVRRGSRSGDLDDRGLRVLLPLDLRRPLRLERARPCAVQGELVVMIMENVNLKMKN